MNLEAEIEIETESDLKSSLITEIKSNSIDFSTLFPITVIKAFDGSLWYEGSLMYFVKEIYAGGYSESGVGPEHFNPNFSSYIAFKISSHDEPINTILELIEVVDWSLSELSIHVIFTQNIIYQCRNIPHICNKLALCYKKHIGLVIDPTTRSEIGFDLMWTMYC